MLNDPMRYIEEFEKRVGLKYARVEKSILDLELSGSLLYLQFDDPTEMRGYCLDIQALNPQERTLVEAGELLPSLAYYWLELSVAIMRYATQRQYIASLCIPSKRFLSLLSVADICHEIYSGAWMSSAQIAIAWGITKESLSQTSFPVKCKGAVYPIIEGLGIGWQATRSDSLGILNLLNR